MEEKEEITFPKEMNKPLPKCKYCNCDVEVWDTTTKPCPCCGSTMIRRELEILWD